MAKGQNNHYTPDYVSPPGETLQELLDERQMTQAELARRMGRPDKTINEIIQGKAGLTPQTALQLEHVLGVPASFWNNREQAYRAFLAKQAENEQLQAHSDWINAFPLKDMVRRGWIKPWNDVVEQIRELLRYFGIASPQQWQERWPQLQVAYRKSQAFKSEPYALSAWLRQGEILAQQISCHPYESAVLKRALVEARAMTRTSPDDVVPLLQVCCAAAGVAVVFVPEVSGVAASGAAWWMNPKKAIIQLSCRYKQDDQVWFSFFHEAGHLLLHGKRELFIEEGEIKSHQEKEANDFAAEFLLPRQALQRFVEQQTPGRYPSSQSIVDFAEKQGIAPGIVVGQLQHDYPEIVPVSHHNRLKRRFDHPAQVAL